MGAIMSSPLTAVHLQRRVSSEMLVGVASMQGWRGDHEDSHILLPDWDSGWSLFGVCDGHAGDRAASFVAKRLPSILTKLSDSSRTPQSITDAFLVCDDEYRDEKNSSDGTTVCIAMARKLSNGTFEVRIANCGDSRCLLISPSALADSPDISKQEMGIMSRITNKESGLLFETEDHKPNNPIEQARIESCGGFVSTDDPARLDGVIAVSRVIGDFTYKSDENRPPTDQKMLAVPDITTMIIQPGDLIVVACDGLFETVESAEVARQISMRLRHSKDLAQIAHDVLKTCLKWDTKDNMTLLIAQVGVNKGDYEIESIESTEEELSLGDFNPKSEQKEKYEAFFSKCGFPTKPFPCEVCHRIFKTMQQCPCRQVVYCGTNCQKLAWKEHKRRCSVHVPAAGAARKTK
jgi:serine/threonine protein phosphatase PrpC